MSQDFTIQISNLEFEWTSNSPLLNIPSLEVKKGERVFLYGPSGSGKSTLLNLIGGVLQAKKGQLSVLGQNLGEMSASQRDQFRGHHIGFIFQMFNLIPYLSIYENVTLPCSFSEKKAEKVRQRGVTPVDEAKRLLSHLKLDIDFENRLATDLSVGQQQRVATARALIGDPELIIADEPTSALDSDTRDAFIQLLFDDCEKTQSSLLFVSHDADLGKHFDRSIDLREINSV